MSDKTIELAVHCTQCGKCLEADIDVTFETIELLVDPHTCKGKEKDER